MTQIKTIFLPLSSLSFSDLYNNNSCNYYYYYYFCVLGSGKKIPFLVRCSKTKITEFTGGVQGVHHENMILWDGVNNLLLMQTREVFLHFVFSSSIISSYRYSGLYSMTFLRGFCPWPVKSVHMWLKSCFGSCLASWIFWGFSTCYVMYFPWAQYISGSLCFTISLSRTLADNCHFTLKRLSQIQKCLVSTQQTEERDLLDA